MKLNERENFIFKLNSEEEKQKFINELIDERLTELQIQKAITYNENN